MRSPQISSPEIKIITPNTPSKITLIELILKQLKLYNVYCDFKESEDDLLDMAIYRLIYAYELSKEARLQFLEYIVNHKKRLSELIIRKRDSGLLQSFLELKDGDENFIADVLAVTDMLALAAEDEWSEGSVILHRFKKENLSVSRKKRFEF